MKTLHCLVLGLTLISCGCAGSAQHLREVYQPINPGISPIETVQVTPGQLADNTVITQTDDLEMQVVTASN